MTSLKKTKREVERQLEFRTARIENAVNRIKGDVASPVSIISRFLRKHPYETLAGVAGVAAVVAWLALRSGSKSGAPDNGDGVKVSYADAVARSIREAEEKGASREDAVQTAIRENPPIVVESHNSKPSGYLHDFGERVLASLTAVAFSYASQWINELVEGRRSTS